MVLVGRQLDPELGAVASSLQRAGVPCLRVDIDWLENLEAVFQPGRRGSLCVAGTEVTPTVVWVRELSPRAIPDDSDPIQGTFADGTFWAASPRAVRGDLNAVEATFVKDSRAAFFTQLAEVSHTFFPGRAPGRLRQLADARELGVRVPSTVVATDPGQAPRSWSRVVVKPLDEHVVEHPPGSLSWFWPRVWDRLDPLPWPRVGVPAMLQEFVEHSAEVRVFYVAGKVCAFQVGKHLPSDLWLAVDRVTVQPVVPPPAVRVAASALAQRWGLRYGAFDFLVRDDEPVFLEVNVDGGWRWFERRAGVAPVTTTAGSVLVDLHRTVAGAHRPGERRSGDRGRKSLVAFLAGRADGR